MNPVFFNCSRLFPFCYNYNHYEKKFFFFGKTLLFRRRKNNNSGFDLCAFVFRYGFSALYICRKSTRNIWHDDCATLCRCSHIFFNKKIAHGFRKKDFKIHHYCGTLRGRTYRFRKITALRNKIVCILFRCNRRYFVRICCKVDSYR